MDSGSKQWTRDDIRRAINDRYLLVRDLERTGFKRLLFASAAFVVYKFFKNRVLDKGDSSRLL